MSTNVPQWQQFEELVARIQRELSPGAEVGRNERIVGRSGVTRRIDVTVRQRLGTYPVFIAFDCKHHSRRVAIAYVSAFADQAADVGANLAVIVSNTGFTDGARRVAEGHNVTLQTLRQAQSADWTRLVDPDSWTSILGASIRGAEVSLDLRQGERIGAGTETRLLNAEHQSVESVNDVFWTMWNLLGQRRQIGRGTVEATTAPGQVFVEHGERIEEVACVRVSADVAVKRWVVHLDLADGHVLQSESGETEYQELTSSTLDWPAIMSSEYGEDLTSDEVQQLMNAGQMTFDLSHANRFIRLTVQTRHDQGDGSPSV